MERRHISTYKLIKDYDFSGRTIYNLKHNISITMVTLGRLCKILNCTPNDIVSFIHED
ncbi:MAG: helix-turn-helix transcriptional regulator [Solobacterium sp.]|nr:helix-turn-helix transcriptional regulator [Solobacterium sp.]